MEESKKREITKILSKAKWILGLGVIIILIIPFLLTREYFCNLFNFSSTGQIGDTIGGTTAPFLNLIGAILIFYALKAQVKANEIIQDQIDKDNNDKECENETSNLNQIYSYLEQSISNFKFKTLPISNLVFSENNTTETTGNEATDTNTYVSGGDAFYKLFSQINCHYHGTLEELFQNQSVSELYSILSIMELLLDKLDKSKSKNKEILKTLIKHQFEYKIINRIRDEELDLFFCETCQCNHGIPDKLKDLIERLKIKFLEN